MVPYRIRALQAATDDLDLPLITEHVTIGSLGGVLAEAGVEDRVLDVPAQEVTTFEYGHFNAFPLVLDADKPNWGGIFPHDKNPVELFDAIRAQHDGEVVIQVNHPRGMAGPGAYFTHVRLDPETLEVNNPDAWSTNWDTIEVFNGDCSTSDSNGKTLTDWIAFTNHGLRKTLASGSDTHGEGSPPGIPRNWIRLDYDAVEADSQTLVEAVRARRMFVSCGPFVRFEAADGTGLGGLTAVDDDGKVSFSVRVEAPTWMAVDEVRLLENGVMVDAVDVSASDDPVVRLDAAFEVTPEADAWYAIEVIGSGSLAPFSRSGPPYALTNPIEVDADGDGDWTAPLPE